jgi:hypothetical protein
MNLLLKIISFAGLGLTILPSVLVFAGTISFELHTNLMFIGMLLWFATAPFWMKEKKL